MNSIIEQAKQTFETWGIEWAICGGMAIDIFLGEETRKHYDLDLKQKKLTQLSEAILTRLLCHAQIQPRTTRNLPKSRHLNTSLLQQSKKLAEKEQINQMLLNACQNSNSITVNFLREV